MIFERGKWQQPGIAGCTPAEIRGLFCIQRGIYAAKRAGIESEGEQSELKVSEISRMMHVTSPTVTQMIKGLEGKGLVERRGDPTDRRSVYVSITDSGLAVVRVASEDMRESYAGLIEYLGEEQTEQLADLMLKAAQYFSDRYEAEQQTYWREREEL